MQVAALQAPSLVATRSRSKEPLIVSPLVFRCCWLTIVVVHLTCAAFVFALATMHALVATPSLYVYLASALQIDLKFLTLAAKTFTVVTCLHLLAVARIIFHSIRHRQLCFRNSTVSRPRIYEPVREPSFVVSSSRLLLHVLKFPVRLVHKWWNRYFALDGLFGLHGEHFDSAFHAREVLEILSQTYQAYFMSVLMVTKWINRLSVSIIFVGCVSTATISFLFRRREMLRRVVNLVADTTLDLCASVIIPMVIVYENVREFDWKTMVFPLELVYDNAWMTQEISRARMLFVWSYLDYLSTVILQLSLLGCILTIERVLQRRQGPQAGSTTLSVVPTCPPRAAPRRRSSLSDPTRKPRREYVGPHAGTLFLVWGIGVLIAHTHANWGSNTKIPSCVLGINPWFSTKPGCAAVSINCHRLGITGASEEATEILEPIESVSLSVLAVMHCPGFVMPDIVREFPNLMSIELTNVTLIRWSKSAALHGGAHHSLGHVFLGHVTLTEFPEGLLHDRLPTTLNDIDFSFTNLTKIPDSVGQLWSDRLWMRINWENTNLTELPQSLSRLPIRRLSLIGNNLSVIDDELLANDALKELYVSGNPLQKLPASLGDRSSMERLFAEHTLVREANEWFNAWYDSTPDGSRKVFFFGSPICSSSASSIAKSPACAMDMGTARGTCPWELIWKLRPV